VQSRTLVLASVSVALAITWLIYRPTLDAYLLNDDFQWLVNARRFTPGQLFEISSRQHFFRPVAEIYFYLVTSFVGQEPRTVRVASLVLHSINLILLAGLMLRLGRSGLIVALTVLLFSTMPSYAEAVSWVSSATVLLATMFYLIALNAYLRFVDSADERFRWLSLASFVAAVGSHESAVTLPAALLTVDAFRGPLRTTVGSRAWWASAARRQWPFFAVLAGYLSLELAINRRNYVVVEGHYRPGHHVITNALRYITALYVGRNTPWSYVMVTLAIGSIVAWGGRLPRVLTILLLTMLVPVLPFTWANTSRYTYLPAMMFAGLTAALLAAGRDRLSVISRGTAWTLLTLITAFLVVRFGRWSVEAGRDHHRVTYASEQCARAVRERGFRGESDVAACAGVAGSYRQALEEYERGRVRRPR
jgi:hypothetical protein